MRFLTTMAAAGSALLIGLASNAAAAPPQALTPQDVQTYAAAFDAAERGDSTTADAQLARVSDPCLVGRVRYLELIRAKPKTNTADQLVDWLKQFGDLAGADKVYALAVKLMPPGILPPPPTAPPVAMAADGGDRIQPSPQSHPAREAYFDGDVSRALTLARADGDAWIAGLAAYRLGRFPEALTSFETIANNAAESDPQRAAGAFWAARTAVAAGVPDQATPMLKVAAALPSTFYGMIAARKLELADDPLDSVIEAAAASPTPPPATAGTVTLTSASYTADGGALARLMANDPRARRAVALAQVGRPIDSGAELRAGIAAAQDDATRAAWMKLMFALNPTGPGANEIVLHSDVAATAPATAYPTPALTPTGGFTIDKALVYAIVWQESRFNNVAVSPVGAVGLMQLMPPSAADIAGEPTLTSDPITLFDTGKNLQLGQAYLSWLMNKATGDDLLRAIAAYNGGPATVSRTEAQLGPNADTLLLIESLPFAETRAYVQKVATAYWSYRRQFGASTRTLDAAASDATVIDARLDASAPSQDAKTPDAAPAREALEILLHRNS